MRTFMYRMCVCVGNICDLIHSVHLLRWVDGFMETSPLTLILSGSGDAGILAWFHELHSWSRWSFWRGWTKITGQRGNFVETAVEAISLRSPPWPPETWNYGHVWRSWFISSSCRNVLVAQNGFWTTFIEQRGSSLPRDLEDRWSKLVTFHQKMSSQTAMCLSFRCL